MFHFQLRWLGVALGLTITLIFTIYAFFFDPGQKLELLELLAYDFRIRNSNIRQPLSSIVHIIGNILICETNY